MCLKSASLLRQICFLNFVPSGQLWKLGDYMLQILYVGSGVYRRRQWHPTPVLLPGKSHGRRSLVGCSPWVAKSQTWLSDFTFTFHFHAMEKEMATHSSALAWRIPGTGEPGGLPSMGSHRVGHDWSDLAVAAVAEYIRANPTPKVKVLVSKPSFATIKSGDKGTFRVSLPYRWFASLLLGKHFSMTIALFPLQVIQ